MDAVVDRFVVGQKHEKAIKAAIAATLLVGDGLHADSGRSKARARRRPSGSTRACAARRIISSTADIEPEYFMFNNPESACRTCGGLGVHKLTHPELLVPDPGAQHPRRLFRARGVQVQPGHLGRTDDVQPGEGAAILARDAVGEAAGDGAQRDPERPRRQEDACISCRRRRRSSATSSEGKEVGFGGIARRIERHYRRYRQRGEANSGMEAWLDKVMVEHTCPDCNGARVRATRLLFTIAGKTIHDVGQLHFDELHAFLGTRQAGRPRRRRGPAGARRDPRPPGAAAGHRARLSEPQSPLRHAVGRRVAAHPPVDADRLGADGDALRARRAEHRPASEGQREDDRHARKPARHRQHRHRGGA